MSIKLLLTGGTIDKSYNESNGELYFTDSHIAEMLELGRNRAEINIQQVLFKDSLQMDDADRRKILQACRHATEGRVLITHGTDTMVETAKTLAAANMDKTIVLTGAMVPFVFKHSDAMFNLGFALGALNNLSEGVYIAMNGKVFDWDKVAKNLDLGEFELPRQ
jgi:L-asparaginase